MQESENKHRTEDKKGMKKRKKNVAKRTDYMNGENEKERKKLIVSNNDVNISDKQSQGLSRRRIKM